MTRQNVHVMVTDAGTRRPVAARLRVRDAAGTPFVPFGRVGKVAGGPGEALGPSTRIGTSVWHAIDAGGCEISLPTGVPLTIDVRRGPEYVPLSHAVTLRPGQMTLRLPLTRADDPASRGWHSADARCHFLSPPDALLEASAEGLALAFVLAHLAGVAGLDGTVYDCVPNLAAFSGAEPALSRGGTAVSVGTLNVHPALGKLALLNAHRPVYPLTFGGPEATDDWSLLDWCDQCHRKGGLAVWADAFRDGAGLAGGEALVAALLGKVDAVEWDARERKSPFLPAYYLLLDAGLTLPLVGASGKASNRETLGAMRTYARLDAGAEVTPTAWADAVRAGRTYVTSGPLLEWSIEGDRLEASAVSTVPFTVLEAVADGAVAGRATPVADGPLTRARLSLDVPPSPGGWLAVRARGEAAFAHTSPTRLAGPVRRTVEARGTLAECVDRAREWSLTTGVYDEVRFRHQFAAHCAAALAVLGVSS